MKRSLMTLAVILASTFLSVGIVMAATRNITSTLGGATGDTFQLSGTMGVNSLRVGAQGTGGVTFFNGSIVNSTTTSGADNPVTFGDNVRIDGRIYRGATAGTSDTLPVLINDNVEIAGSLTVASIASAGVVTSANIADDGVGTADLADSAVTTAKIASGAVTQGLENALTTLATTHETSDYDTLNSLSITTGDSSLFCIWSGYGDTQNTEHKLIRVQMTLDGVVVDRTIRIIRSSGSTSHSSLGTQAILPVTAGTHTVAIQWNTDSGANMYQANLDCIELKK